MSSISLNIIIVEKLGSLKVLSVKEFKEEDLYKKCGFKKADDFIKQTEWDLKYDGNKYYVSVYAKTEGRGNNENKYDFPPPIDKKLFFGNCAIVAKMKQTDGNKHFVNLTLPMWNKMYEKLFGGFEDLNALVIDDEDEEDELDLVPKENKTKDGYLKDGFVVDSDGDDEYEYETESNSIDCIGGDKEENLEAEDDEPLIIEDIASELSEEEYDYSE
jgi:hypothetical protein